MPTAAVIKGNEEEIEMGLLDHRKTWHFDTALPPEQCAHAFVQALTGRSAVSLSRGKWVVNGDNGALVATYGGRSGLMAAASVMSERAQSEEMAGVGSQISFKVEGEHGSRTRCSMWLSQHGSIFLFFIPEARILRSYMNGVARRIRQADHTLAIAKT